MERPSGTVTPHTPLQVGVVVIGRNEGRRLERCLDSLRSLSVRVVYVDSGSTDGSVNAARSRDAEVVQLDLSTPFTAARARNEGFARLLATMPELQLVQFVDGDCELNRHWLETAGKFLHQLPDVACVCGRLRERYPERSVYNRLCDAEWNRPPGATDACGGIAMMRADVFRDLAGFRADLVAGEEPELCSRIKRAGWQVWRLSDEMAWHDADMHRFGQWWMRARRAGHTFAQSSRISHHLARQAYRRRIVMTTLWATIVPTAVLAALLTGNPWWMLLLLAYPAQIARLAWRLPPEARWEQAFFTVLGKFPEFQGQCQFLLRALRRQGGISFDYKS